MNFYVIVDMYVLANPDGSARTFETIEEAVAVFGSDNAYEKSLDGGSDGVWKMTGSGPDAPNDVMVWNRRSASLA